MEFCASLFFDNTNAILNLRNEQADRSLTADVSTAILLRYRQLRGFHSLADAFRHSSSAHDRPEHLAARIGTAHPSGISCEFAFIFSNTKCRKTA